MAPKGLAKYQLVEMNGAWMLEESEFAHVFPESFEQQNSSPNSSTNRDEKAFERNALQGEIQAPYQNRFSFSWRVDECTKR